jgi:hypothetical protein
LGKTRHKKIFIGSQAGTGLSELRPVYMALLEAATRDDDVEVRKLLKRIVPSYSHPEADEKVVSIESGKFDAIAPAE